MIHVRQLGVIPYREAWALQEELRTARAADTIPDTVLLCEHPPVFTIGRQECRADWRATFACIERAGIEVVQVNRGGRITYHGPGQLVGYFICDLRARRMGIRAFVTAVEQLLIRVVSTWGIVGTTDPDYPGVWVGRPPKKIAEEGCAREDLPPEADPRLPAGGQAPPEEALPVRASQDVGGHEMANSCQWQEGNISCSKQIPSLLGAEPPKKIAALGLHVSRGVTQHGFALNVAPNLAHYHYIIPCGIADRGVTSLAELLRDDAPSMDAVIRQTASNVGASSAIGSS